MVLPRGGGGGRGGYHSRGGGSRGGGRSSYHGSGSYHSSNHNSSYDNRNDSRNNRYGGSSTRGGGAGGSSGGYDSRNSSRYESDSRYSRHDSRTDAYKRTNSSKYEDNRDRRSPDRKRARNDHNSQGGSSRREYGGGGSSSSVVRGRGGGGGSSSSRYHEAGSSGSSYDKRGSHEHHSSTSGGGPADSGSSRSKFEPHHRSSSSASVRSHSGVDSGSSYRSRDNNSSSMGPPRSVAMRTSGNGGVGGAGRSMMRPAMSGSSRMLGGGSGSSLGGGIGGGIHRRGPMRGRISHYRSDGRRGMLNSRIISGSHHRRLDMRPMSLHNRRFPSIRGRGDMRNRIIGGNIGPKRTIDNNTKLSRRALIKRAIQAAKDVYEHSASENEDDDEEDEGVDDEEEEPTPKKMKKTNVESNADDEDIRSKHGDDVDGEKDDASSVKIKKEDEEHNADTTDTTMGEDGDDSVKQQTPIKKRKILKKEPSSVEKADEDRKVLTDEASEKKRSTKITTKYRSSSFIKLTCVHCNLKWVTFKEYQTHLYSRLHKMKMRQLAVKCRERLLEMRAAQRNTQKDVDEKSENTADGEDVGGKQRAGFCLLCRLNYRQPRATHQQSDGHKEMKNFLMPYCTVCKIGFKSPMAYETHRASLDHLKIKARVERYASAKGGDDSGDELTGDLVDLKNLTIVDEVGKVDEICEPGLEKEASGGGSGSVVRKREFDDIGRTATDDEDDEEDEEEDEDDEDMQMIIGEEYVKKVEVQYCELCNIYLHRRVGTQDTTTLRDHCKKQSHLRLYIRFRNDKKLREQAERIHKKKLKGDKEAASAKKGDEKKPKDAGTSNVVGGASGDSKSAGTTASTSDSVSASTGLTTAATTAAVVADGGTSHIAEKKHASNEFSGGVKSEHSNVSTSATSGTAQPNATVEGPATRAAPSEESASLDASKDADTSSLGDDVNTSLIDDKLMWQVVDNDELGDLLRDVNDAEEEDDDKTSLERYDKFRHTEKNGLEQQALVEEDSADKPTGGQLKTATNGDGANGDARKEAKTADA